MNGIDKDGGPAYHTITQAVKNLVARWMLEITANIFVNQKCITKRKKEKKLTEDPCVGRDQGWYRRYYENYGRS